MTKVIIIQGQSLDSFYDQTIDYLHAKYHSYPDYSPDIQIDNRTAMETIYGERMAEQIQAQLDQGVPPGKIVC